MSSPELERPLRTEAQATADIERNRDLVRLQLMARRYDAEAIRYRRYVANTDFGATAGSEQLARDAAADAATIRRVLAEWGAGASSVVLREAG